jgi:hypothetical protein
MNFDGRPTATPPTARFTHGKEMSARIGIGILFIVLAGCMLLVGWTVHTRS